MNIWVIEIKYRSYDHRRWCYYYDDWRPSIDPPQKTRKEARKLLAKLKVDHNTIYYKWKYRIAKYKRLTKAA